MNNRARARRSLKDVFASFAGLFYPQGPAKLTDPSEVNEPSGFATAASGYVTVESALQLSAAWACIRLLSETIATLPCNLFERMPNGERRPASSHPLYDLLHNQPNADMTAATFWQAYVASLLTHGGSYVEKKMQGERPIALDFLAPSRMQCQRVANGASVFRYLEDDNKTFRVIPENKMWHTPAFTLDGRRGLSPIKYGAGIFGAAMAAEGAAAHVFANGMRPSGVLKTDKLLQPKQREDLRTNIVNKFSGVVNSGGTMVLEAGLSYERLSIPPEDAQLLQTRAFGIEEVCRWYGVPPILVGHSEKVTAWGSGIEQIVIGFLTFSLRPWLARIEQSVRRSLLTPQERSRFYAEFSVEGLLRADSGARAAFYSTMAQNGVMSRNEIRRLENLPKADGGDVLTVQSNLIALTKLLEAGGGASDAAAAFRAALANFMVGAGDDEP